MSKKLLVTVLVLVSLMFSVQNVFADVVLDPPQVSVECENNFDLKILADTGDSKLGAVDFLLTFDPDVIEVDTTQGDNGIDLGPDAGNFTFIPAPSPGQLIVVGFSAAGIAPGNPLDLLVIHFKALTHQKICDSPFPITLQVRNYATELGDDIDPGTVLGSEVTITCQQITCRSNHYLSYKVRQTPRTPKFELFTVKLADQFETKDFVVKRVAALYNPAVKTFGDIVEPIVDEDTHLVGYAISQAKKSCIANAPENAGGACRNGADCGGDKNDRTLCLPTPPHQKQDVRIDNQFGTTFVKTILPELLLLPSSKNLDGQPAPPLDPVDLDHYKCYKVKELRNICESDPFKGCRNDSDCPNFPDGAPGICNKGLAKNLIVILEDQFGQKKAFSLRSNRLCNPVEKTHNDVTFDIIDRENHYMCYVATPLKKACTPDSPTPYAPCKVESQCGGTAGVTKFCQPQERHERREKVVVTNQFDVDRLIDTIKEENLCVPSKKTPLND